MQITVNYFGLLAEQRNLRSETIETDAQRRTITLRRTGQDTRLHPKF